MNTSVTGLVLTYNGERLLENCLSTLDFCDEILVVDSESSDATREIAERMGARVLVRPWEGPGPQFRYAFENISSQWVVSLDQDEYLDPGLRQEIIRAMDSAPADTAAFEVSRRSFYFDRFLKHSGWYPDYLYRVFRPALLDVQVSGAHYSFHPRGNTSRLSGGDIVHYPYRNFSEHMDKINSYAQQAADEMKRKGKRGGLGKALGHGLFRFFKLYCLKLGALDGRAGFVNALAGSYYAFQKYIRVEETGDWGP